MRDVQHHSSSGKCKRANESPQGGTTSRLLETLLSKNQKMQSIGKGREWNPGALLVGTHTRAAKVGSSVALPQKVRNKVMWILRNLTEFHGGGEGKKKKRRLERERAKA